MAQFFITIWLKKEDTNDDKKKFVRILNEIASKMPITLEGEINLSTGGNRLTVRGTIDSKSPDKVLTSFTKQIEEQTKRKSKGKIIS